MWYGIVSPIRVYSLSYKTNEIVSCPRKLTKLPTQDVSIRQAPNGT